MSEPPPTSETPSTRRLRGIAGSPGVAIGPAVVVGLAARRFRRYHVAVDQLDAELDRFRAAVHQAKAGLRRLMQRASHLGAEITILEAYVAMLGDPTLAEHAERSMRSELRCAEWAVTGVLHQMTTQIQLSDSPYLRERGHDFDFVADLLVRALQGEPDGRPLVKLERASIVVAHDLSPADTAGMVREPVIAIVTEVGTRTSHSSIMARALEIPAVVGVSEALAHVSPGDELIVDGLRGEIVVAPGQEEMLDAREREQRHLTVWRRLRATRGGAPCTACGVPIALRANIELPGEALLAADHGAQGIGLYRTEFLYMDRSVPPSEDEQYVVYRTVTETVAPHSATLRTFDLGGDKFVSSFEVPAELNPALGLRAVRLGLARPDVFLQQLRAMVRASAHGRVHVLVPMIATLGELRQVRELLDAAISEVDRRGQPRAPIVPFGVMMEVPSAALLAERFAREADFMSLGTNDLIQYTLATDRTSRAMAYLSSPFDPAVLRLVDSVARASVQHAKPLSICGEMASSPLGAILLIGLGLRELSMEAAAVPEIKEVLRRVSVAEAAEAARAVLELDTAQDVEAALARRFGDRLRDLPGAGT
jgi:phosphotransferase system enzyme I (PtsI)